MIYQAVIYGFALLLAVIAIIKVLRPLSFRIRLVDVPGGRKRHDSDTPIIGGLAMFFSFFAISIFLPADILLSQCFYVCSFILIFVGVIDDLVGVSYKKRLLLQSIVGVIMVIFGHNQIATLGDLFATGSIHLGHVSSMILTVMALLGIINAMNMLDGMDGLVGSLSITQFILLLILSLIYSSWHIVFYLVLMICSLIGFLFFNFPSRISQSQKVYMGDAGSMYLGFVTVWFSLSLLHAHHKIQPITFSWMVALPLFEIVRVVVRRLLKGRSPFMPDRSHVHHLFLSAGFTESQCIIVAVVFSLSMGGIGILLNLYHLPEFYSTLCLIIMMGTYFLLPEAIWVLMKKMNRERLRGMS